MNLLTFQAEAVDRLDQFLRLVARRRQAGSADVCKTAWNESVFRLGGRHYCEMIDASGNDIPCVSIVIPTGGGKTITAMAGAIKALKVRDSRENLIVWVVPSEAIYTQTKEYLTSGYLSEFAMRSGFDRLILKLNGDSWTDFDMGPGCLTVVLVTQQSIFSEKAESIFSRNSDLFQSLSPGILGGRSVKSLKELLEVVRPVFVIDEAHRTYTENGRHFFRSNSLAWCLLEFSATPKYHSSEDYPNVLVSVRADRLVAEQLLKTPLQIHMAPTDSVESILDQVISLRSKLESGLFSEGFFVKPKVLVSCYRTSEEQAHQRNSAHSIRDILAKKGVPKERIAFKTSERDDLGDVSVDTTECVFEYILTKQALVEGWDAKSVYIIVLVNEIGAKLSNFQIVGRGLRQPNRSYFKNPELNSLSVFASGVRQNAALKSLQDFLSGQGLDALAVSGDVKDVERIEFKLSGKFSAPMLLLEQDRAWFDSVGVMRATSGLPGHCTARDFLFYSEQNPSSVLAYGVDDGSKSEIESELEIVREPPSPYIWRCRFISRLSNLVGDFFSESKYAVNWVESQFAVFSADQLFDKLCQRDPEGVALFVAHNVRGNFELQRCTAFIEEMKSAKLVSWCFDSEGRSLIADKTQKKFAPFRNSLIGDVPKTLFNMQELDFAYYLDSKGYKWLRNSPGAGWYYLPGGLSGRFYPDFIVLHDEADPNCFRKITLIETKGGHLINNLDSMEKRRSCDEITRISNGSVTVIFDGFEDAKKRLAALGIPVSAP